VIDYKKVYRVYQNNNFGNDLFGLFDTAKVSAYFDPAYQKDLENKHKELFPRRKKINLANIPDSELELIKNKWMGRARAYYTKRCHQRKLLGSVLDANCENVDMTPAESMSVMRSSNTSTYASQGFGAHKYARSALNSDYRILSDAGFTVEVTESESGRVTYFSLMANATDYQLDALRRLDNGSLLEWAVRCWKSGTNPKVYNPFLPDGIFDESMAIAMGNKK